MPTPETVVATFGLLDAAAIPRPKGWASLDVVGVATEWARLMSALTDEQAIQAVREYIASGAKWWPTPGQLLQLVPASSAPQLTGNAWHPMAQALIDSEQAEHGHNTTWTDEQKERHCKAVLLIHCAEAQTQRDWVVERYAAGDWQQLDTAWARSA